ncbi:MULTISPECIES: alpha/beta fold hydrolase [Arthrospira]|jgi:pimeloyl-ACP methyl ester carboxylesterase|uniref:Serine aminopeptidase S33 domain-containing protein n=1 Tax=Limnospira platensis NIES-46 TaxID=1236695 RepID=A0A5M3T5X8_LIMPL|nr:MULTISPECIES: alpha/beta fold hydrolase [Arthrospira]AMW30915.1 alpha/beta hydrolase [Arthrospira platensis YZ]MBD2667755.1 alpha/beta fold hydrolase [Arthrospira platensis FACHB-439]MBD2709073.1 alpha/beta fold hydrolase [Arthrospira platensis FACHB-835]MDF2208258.1 alpha/beta fold hydrolase [Arthrospira platensis NCB002]MDT9296788.1 alpha/beta fold hydrolase [Arthrospira platensis PCC 7345]QQW28816.1 alpha/beta fold hydrolase [Arthrospira sp. PCC 9108]BAI93757.1 hypothetical protein NIE
MYFFNPTPGQSHLPLFLFLPGMDGTGRLLRTQQRRLSQFFNLRCLTIPPEDVNDWDTLTDRTVALIQQELSLNLNQDIYICGESFGGCLAMKVAMQIRDQLKGLILVNPASAFKQQPWIEWGSHLTDWLPSWLYPLSMIGFLPFLAKLPGITIGDRQALLEAMQSVPQRTSSWRLGLLRSFDIQPDQLRQLDLPVLVIASGSDRLLPSITEAQFLTRKLPKANMVILPNSGHACLLETDVNLCQIIRDHDLGQNLTKTQLVCQN